MDWLSQIFGFFQAFQIWVTVAPWEEGLLVRMGKRAKRISPGVWFRVPFLDRIFIQSVRLRTISDMGQTVSTRDGQSLTLNVAVTYQIENIERLYMSVSHPETTLLCLVQSLIAEFVCRSERGELKPATIESYVSSKLPSVEWGLSKLSVKITTFVFARTYRVMNYGYSSFSSANELEKAKK